MVDSIAARSIPLLVSRSRTKNREKAVFPENRKLNQETGKRAENETIISAMPIKNTVEPVVEAGLDDL
jgi:hypothetical protein